nr:protein ALP1-like [Tanacetum cinerariifolium]
NGLKPLLSSVFEITNSISRVTKSTCAGMMEMGGPGKECSEGMIVKSQVVADVIRDVVNYVCKTKMSCNKMIMKVKQGILSLPLKVVGNKLDNDINVLHQSSLFNDLKTGQAPKISFVANSVTYPWGYYLVDGIYSKLVTLVKTILEPSDDDHKRIRYKQMQKMAKNDVERAFGVLKKWAILANLARAMKKKNNKYDVYMHNMIQKYKEKAISSNCYPKEAH